MTRFVLVLALAGWTAAAELPSPDRIDKIFAKWDSTVTPGCALSVIKDGHIVYARGYGMADLDHDIPIRTDSVFHVASVSKQFTAAAIVLLAQDGKLSLDDEVRKYIPELPDFGVPITIRHLIHHTSGLRDQWELLGLAGWRYSLDLITDDDVLQLVSRQRDLNFKPGGKHVYCNTGYTLLAQIVKRVSKQSFRQFTSSRIFEPLGMKNTHFRDDHAEVVKHQAYGYERGEAGAFRLSVTNFDTVGATSLLTTVEDLALWDQNFYEPRVGGPGLLRQLLERGKTNDGKPLDYAFGLSLGKYRGLATVDHGGADAGYRSDLLRFPEQHFSVACLCNLGDANPSGLARQVADVYLEGLLKEPEKGSEPPAGAPVKIAEEKLRSYAGLYWNREEERALRIGFDKGKLALVEGTDEKYELRPVADNRFRLQIAPIDLTFTDSRLSVHHEGSTKADVFDAVPELKLSPAELAAFAGPYRSEEIDPVYRIAVEKDGLVLTRLKSKPDQLQPVLADYFQGSVGVLHFLRDPGGRVTGFLLNTGRIRNFRFSRQ